MKLLAIETSCDETAVAVLSCTGDESNAHFKILGNGLLSQIDIHREYGGVFPMVAKREHAKNLIPLLDSALEEAEMLRENGQALPHDIQSQIAQMLEREPELSEAFLARIPEIEVPDIDAITVTAGPGLEPALWVGVNFARALSLAWGKPIVAVNHMEGHLLSALTREEGEELVLDGLTLPVLALLISGGHTELVLMREWLAYELIGQTRDDAVGEAFDKVARMIGLPYPGGPEISALAERDREDFSTAPFTLPRPMLHDPHFDFSFSGLKTAVMYLLKGKPELGEIEKEQLAREFEDAVTDVLWAKTSKALEDTGANTLTLGGGVSANIHIRRTFTEEIAEKHPQVELRLPATAFTTDNAVMIGIAGYFHALKKDFTDVSELRANGNLSLAPKE